MSETFSQAFLLHQKGQLEQARTLYAQVLQSQPQHAHALHLQGAIAAQTGQAELAAVLIAKSIAVDPGNAIAYNNRGVALEKLHRYQAALRCYDRAILVRKDLPDAHDSRGNALACLKRFQEAIDSFGRAVSLKPDWAVPYSHRGNALHELRQHKKSLADSEKAIAIDPAFPFLFGMILLRQLQTCNWRNAADQSEQLLARITRGEKVADPFPMLAISGSAALQQQACASYVADKHGINKASAPLARHRQHRRIRLGYFSADYHDHATSHLMAELIETHSRADFELFAFSFGPTEQDAMRQRLVQAFDHFLEVQDLSDREIALRARDLEIDIAIDLKGYTQDNRSGIFAARAAPIQVSYLGFPGTMCAEFIDYLVADATLIDESDAIYYSEKIAYLPNSYQVNDRQRAISDRIFSREELGLPPAAFVFCCFNNTFKITPEVFDVWLEILRRVPASVIWLLGDNAIAEENLRRYAAARNVDADRLVFARRMPLAEHLSRHRAADLFLDTLPYNAHTTASDALWAGLPVLTLAGQTFAGRVAASLLKAIRLPELIVQSRAQYQSMAVELATNPDRLQEIRRRLAHNRLVAPLFDTPLFAKHIESAYAEMHGRYRAGLPPATIRVAA